MKNFYKLLPILLTLTANAAASQFTPAELTPEERVLERLRDNKQREEERINLVFENDRERWGECYGGYQYDWMGWKKATNGTWTTDVRMCWRSTDFQKEPPQSKEAIAVTCSGLKVSKLYMWTTLQTDWGWSKWRDPWESEEAMIAKLCAREEQ